MIGFAPSRSSQYLSSWILRKSNQGNAAMKKIDQLNPLARRMADTLFVAFPSFARRLEVIAKGDFRTHIRAPKGSKAYGLRVCTLNGEDTWVQFGVQYAWYPVDTEKELLEIVRGLLTDRLKFAVKERHGKHTWTTLVRKAEDLAVKRGEVAKILSWSGTKDAQLIGRVGRPRANERVTKRRTSRK